MIANVYGLLVYETGLIDFLQFVKKFAEKWQKTFTINVYSNSLQWFDGGPASVSGDIGCLRHAVFEIAKSFAGVTNKRRKKPKVVKKTVLCFPGDPDLELR